MINNEASEADQQATKDFLDWVIADTGRDAIANTMGFVTPFGLSPTTRSIQPLLADAAYREAGKTWVTWNFTTMPSEEWKNGVGRALLQYAQGTPVNGGPPSPRRHSSMVGRPNTSSPTPTASRPITVGGRCWASTTFSTRTS